MAAWIVCALCALILIKPQEFIGALAGLPLLYIALAAASLAAVLDVVWRRIRPSLAPHLPFAFAFFAWAVLTTAVRSDPGLGEKLLPFSTAMIAFVAVSVGAASSKGLRAFGVTFLGCGLLVTGVAIAQGLGPRMCMVAAPDDWQGAGELARDGRPCETVLDCRTNAPDPEANYRCERAGPLGTATQRGRVRYRGSLADPNELALMACLTIPFAFAIADRGRRRARASPPPGPLSSGPRSSPPSSRRLGQALPPAVSDRLVSSALSLFRSIPALAVVAAIGIMVAMTSSRTGAVAYLVVLGLYFIRRFRAWGLVLGGLFGPLLLLLAVRGRTDAEDSADERVELLREAFEMLKRTRGVGVGLGRFIDESDVGLTAHNAYLLAASEAGLVGLCLFGLVLYAALKVPLAIWFGDYQVDRTVRRFAPAVFVSLCGALAGIFFLSWTYKDVLYMVLGASAALYGAARAQDGRVSVRLSLLEIALVCAGMLALLVAINVALRVLA